MLQNKKYKEIDNLDGLDPYSTSKVCAKYFMLLKMGLKLIMLGGYIMGKMVRK